MTLKPASPLFVFSLFCFHANAEIVLPKVFSPHMVLQREMPVPIWGTAAPGEKFEVQFRNQRKTVEADSQGKWRVSLDPLSAGGPDTLKVGDKALEDVLVGEVWVGSGQSNMAMSVSQYTAGDAPLAQSADVERPQLRFFGGAGGTLWQESTPQNNQKFSALLFAFGQSLQGKLGVPVGLIVGAVGGTPSGFWLSEEMYKADAACQDMVRQRAPGYDYDGLKQKYDADKAKWDADMAEWKRLEAEAKAAGKTPPRAPAAPRAVGRAGEANSGKIGFLFEALIRPVVGYGIRGVLWDQGESKTNIACVDQYALMGALIKGWRKDWGQDFPFLYVQKPSGGGVAWDPSDPLHVKAEKFVPQPAQLPQEPDPEYSHELHLRLMDFPKTYMVTSTDLGGSVHPVMKSSYGRRASDVALRAVYGDKAEFYGPLYASHSLEGSRLRIKFSHTGKGLAVRHSEQLQGFTICGADRKFVWAEARIDGDSVVVSHPSIAEPAAVRYAWSPQFPWANLFNRDGLPAQPFRTDRW
jgi:sialate O-acetylesterase